MRNILPLVFMVALLLACDVGGLSVTSSGQASPPPAPKTSPTAAVQSPTQPPPTAVASVPTPDAALYDNFDGGSLDLALWSPPVDTPSCFNTPSPQMIPKDGALVIDSKCPGAPYIVEARKGNRKRENMQLFELRLKVGGNQKDAVGKFWMQINESAGQNWRTQCVISMTVGANPQLKCDVQGGEFNTNFVTLNFDTWHNVKMTLNPNSMELGFYLDGQQLGNITPARSNTLSGFTPGFGVANQGNGALNTIYLVYVRISP